MNQVNYKKSKVRSIKGPTWVKSSSRKKSKVRSIKGPTWVKNQVHVKSQRLDQLKVQHGLKVKFT